MKANILPLSTWRYLRPFLFIVCSTVIPACKGNDKGLRALRVTGQPEAYSAPGQGKPLTGIFQISDIQGVNAGFDEDPSEAYQQVSTRNAPSGIVPAPAVARGKVESQAAGKPDQLYYSVHFSSRGCNFTICINDVPVFTHTDGGSLDGEMPINHLILHSGPQTVKYVLLPLKGQSGLASNSSLAVSITSSDVDDLTVSKNVAVFKPLAVKQGKQARLQQQQQFNAAVPYQIEGWQHGADLRNDPSLNTALVQAYQNMLQLITSKKYAELKKYFESKVKEADIATYSDDSGTEEEWSQLTNYLSMPGTKCTFDANKAQLHVFGEGKLVTLMTPDGQPALRIYHLKDKSEYQLPLYFYRRSIGQPLTLIR